ncbi:hypothetical protein Dimus_034046 [Dionaea muscipula]
MDLSFNTVGVAKMPADCISQTKTCRGGRRPSMEEDERREAAIASTSCLQYPNFKPSGVTQNQLTKFQELHRRRLQMKSKSSHKKKPKGGKVKLQEEDYFPDDNANTEMEASSVDNSKSSDSKDVSVSSQIGINHILKRRQKLYWGLDAKERWERKANM